MVDGKTHSFGGTDVIEKGGEVIGELFERILLGFIRFVSLTITQHIWGDDAIASLNPRTDLIFPGNPNSRCMINK